ncbi:hypothetical protein BU14_0021s0018 [Porphyra umbilicalis]|uniref:Uncharacterized protein n=1 Tax=Porphyra umbilicalis TaxID=2786 RepID=A0A1X6PL77_PORUM|nr:hypothetical protein BU14_0021s0018 [Porphyra umbilicalis]|eukprot:OSX81413.1 hypothetical protein BU14_0021s0018 [Porphyra umbilicalis]
MCVQHAVRAQVTPTAWRRRPPALKRRTRRRHPVPKPAFIQPSPPMVLPTPPLLAAPPHRVNALVNAFVVVARAVRCCSRLVVAVVVVHQHRRGRRRRGGRGRRRGGPARRWPGLVA